jgi:hypothetical protein
VTVSRLRLATAPDAEAICRIYNQGIEDRVATLETELRTHDERRQWLAARGPRQPVIVAEALDANATGETRRVGATSTSLRPPSVQGGLTAPATTVQGGLTAPATTVQGGLTVTRYNNQRRSRGPRVKKPRHDNRLGESQRLQRP